MCRSDEQASDVWPDSSDTDCDSSTEAIYNQGGGNKTHSISSLFLLYCGINLISHLHLLKPSGFSSVNVCTRHMNSPNRGAGGVKNNITYVYR